MVKRTPIFRPRSRQQADAGQRGLEGALHATELVVRFADAVERDADVVEVGIRRCWSMLLSSISVPLDDRPT
jgi:hypothetical protein